MLSGTFAPLRSRDYRLLWFGQGVHAFALWMEQIARPFLVLAMTDGSAAHVGGVLAVRTVPQLFFGVFAGVVTDWFDRRAILVITKVSVFILSALFAALMVFGRLELWHVYVFQFIRGTFMAFDQPTRQSMIASLVPPEQMVSGVALMSGTQNVMRILGSTAGGLGIWVFGLTGAFVVVAIIYVGAVVTTWMISTTVQQKPQESGARAMANGLVEGATWAWGNTTIRAILLLSFVYFTFGMAYTQVFVPLFAVQVMHIGEAGAGLMVSLTGAGALVSVLVISSWQPTRVGIALPFIVWTFGLMLVGFSLATYLPNPYGLILPFIFMALTGSTQTLFFSLSNATMLTVAPPEMRGRVISLLSLDRGLMSLGGMGAGFLVELRGVQIAQITFGVVCIVGGLAVLLLYREFRIARLDPAAIEAAGRAGRHGEGLAGAVAPSPAPASRPR